MDHRPRCYPGAVIYGGVVYVSGQGAIDLVSGEVVGSSIEEQLRQTFRTRLLSN